MHLSTLQLRKIGLKINQYAEHLKQNLSKHWYEYFLVSFDFLNFYRDFCWLLSHSKLNSYRRVRDRNKTSDMLIWWIEDIRLFIRHVLTHCTDISGLTHFCTFPIRPPLDGSIICLQPLFSTYMWSIETAAFLWKTSFLFWFFIVIFVVFFFIFPHTKESHRKNRRKAIRSSSIESSSAAVSASKP